MNKSTKEILKDRESKIAYQNSKIAEREALKQSEYWRVK